MVGELRLLPGGLKGKRQRALPGQIDFVRSKVALLTHFSNKLMENQHG
jgi:hypothetical protein